jgi:KipI family sensor histidine kinase inhibitor
LRWGDSADIAVNRQVHGLAKTLLAAAPPWLIDCVPAYASLAIFFDAAALPGHDSSASVREYLQEILERPESPSDDSDSRLVEIPVCYGGEHGPDLDDLAVACGLSAAQVVEKHSRGDYLVAMLGFSPGFPYLLGLDAALESPRLATPRLHVPAGSVGIAGAQTGIYPNDSPGGWRLIGRTPRRLFAIDHAPPTLLQPGDRVRFVPIDVAQYLLLDEHSQ